MDVIPTFVPSQVCLSCDGCCRFDSDSSQWRVKLAKEDVQSISKTYDKSFSDEKQYLNTMEVNEQASCIFFNDMDHTCGVYRDRPWECRLYPFLLTKYENGIGVKVHLSCPYVKENFENGVYSDYIVQLKEYFSGKETIDFIKRNENLISEYENYESELANVFPLDL